MSGPRDLSEVLSDHVSLEVEGIDRMYLNVYVPQWQGEVGVVGFFRYHRGSRFVSSALMDPISKNFVAAVETFAKQEQIPVVPFRKGQRKDDIAAEHLSRFNKTEGVLFIGKAQEKTPVLRTERRRSEKSGATYPWLVPSTARVNHFYVYCVDRDFGPHQVVRPIEVDGQRASALRFGDPRVQALFAVLAVFSLQLQGFTNAEMRALLAQLLGLDPATYPAGRMTYDLRRLRLHGIIERIPRSHRYQLTPCGLRIALFFSRAYARLLRPTLAAIMPQAPPTSAPIRVAFERLQSAIDACCQDQRLVACI
jgi:hypothetical protein